MTDESYDVVMAGGGLMGCAIATYLLRFDPTLRVALIEMDPTYECSSTVLSDGNMRVQFNIKENIQISQYGMQVMATFAEDMAVEGDKPDPLFRRQGNLFLVDEAGRAEAERGLALQQSLGCQVEWLMPEAIREVYPLCDPTGCVGGTYGKQDGTMDPWSVLMAYRKKAVALGAEFIYGEVVELLMEGAAASGVRLRSGERLTAGVVVNSAGAWAPRLARTVGIELPVEPVKRQVFVIATNARPTGVLPGLFMPSGLYCIHERAGQFMVGKSLDDDPVCYEFTWDRALFTEVLWPELIEYVPSFDRLKVEHGWAGLYAVCTLDGNALLGEWPDLERLYHVTGFSGHGFQQCHAVGRYLAELILGFAPSLDLSIFSPRRAVEGRPVFENVGRLI